MSSATLPVQIQLRTSIENKSWLKEAADAQERSVNWLVHKLVTEARLTAQQGQNAQS